MTDDSDSFDESVRSLAIRMQVTLGCDVCGRLDEIGKDDAICARCRRRSKQARESRDLESTFGLMYAQHVDRAMAGDVHARAVCHWCITLVACGTWGAP